MRKQATAVTMLLLLSGCIQSGGSSSRDDNGPQAGMGPSEECSPDPDTCPEGMVCRYHEAPQQGYQCVPRPGLPGDPCREPEDCQQPYVCRITGDAPEGICDTE